MQTPKEITLERIDRLLAKGRAVLETHRPNPPNVIGFPTLDANSFSEWRTQCISMLQALAGESSVYTKDFEIKVQSGHRNLVESGLGILRAFHDDCEHGYLTKFSSLIRAEVFSDFLEMTSHLLSMGYKDPAASLCGAVLENGLRKIAVEHAVEVKAGDDISSLNQKLAQAGVYNQLVRQQVQVWNTLRNKADHGQFSEYGVDDVKAMTASVAAFLSNHL